MPQEGLIESVILASRGGGVFSVTDALLKQPLESVTFTVYRMPPLRLDPILPVPPEGDHK